VDPRRDGAPRFDGKGAAMVQRRTDGAARRLARPTLAVTEMLAGSRRSADLTSATAMLSLALGEPDDDTPQLVVDAMVRALRSGHTRYVDLAGDPELREAIAEQTTAATGVAVTGAEVTVTHGATAGLAAAVTALVGPGDRVVFPDPTYSLYTDLVRLAGGIPVPVPTTAEHHLDLDALSAALPGARAFLYCSPCNPTGAVYRRDELEALGALLAGTDTVVVADEAYLDFDYTGTFTCAWDVPALVERVVLVRTFSKSYAMTGFRVGHVVARHPLIDHVVAVHRTFNSAVNAPAQRAALAALGAGPALVEPVRARYRRRRRVLLDCLRAIPELETPDPEGAFYVFPRVRSDVPSTAVAAALAAAGVKVRAGSEFGAGGEGHLRLAYAADEPVLVEAAARIRTGLATLLAGVPG
jgi:aspartate aminotransferase